MERTEAAALTAVYKDVGKTVKPSRSAASRSLASRLTNSCPAMDQGSAEKWIQALDHVLDLPVKSVVPGHFELATKTELRRFRDYLNDLYSQVHALYQKGDTIEEVRRGIHMEKYKEFRQYEKYEATFADNAAVIYQQLQHH